MVKRILEWLQKWLTWMLEKIGAEVLVLAPDLMEMIPDAVELVKQWDKHPDTSLSGEYKLSQVYGKMVKLYPAKPRHRISLAIALAVSSQR